jgi:hypothetical protein
MEYAFSSPFVAYFCVLSSCFSLAVSRWLNNDFFCIIDHVIYDVYYILSASARCYEGRRGHGLETVWV